MNAARPLLRHLRAALLSLAAFGSLALGAAERPRLAIPVNLDRPCELILLGVDRPKVSRLEIWKLDGTTRVGTLRKAKDQVRIANPGDVETYCMRRLVCSGSPFGFEVRFAFKGGAAYTCRIEGKGQAFSVTKGSWNVPAARQGTITVNASADQPLLQITFS